MQHREQNRTFGTKAAYFLLWAMIFIMPVCFMLFGNRANITDFRGVAHISIFAWALVVVFAFNYTILIDLYFYSCRIRYIAVNIILVGMLSLIMFAWERMEFDVLSTASRVFPDGIDLEYEGYEYISPLQPKNLPDIFRPLSPVPHHILLFFTGKVLPLMLMVGMAIAVKAIYKLNKAEREVKELERSRTEAELKNLRNQLNPHFLFNTLNNIYALIDISPDKARSSILRLSDMMRHVLYDDNKSRYISLTKEIRFIEDYVSLMKLRMNDNLDIKVDLPENTEGIMVAPLMYISLIENAFKHGVSVISPSFLSIEIKVAGEKVVCRVRNSYFPKGKEDDSGSGVGVSNLRKRLDLIYGTDYEYETKHNDKEYEAKLILPVKRKEEQ